MKNLHNFRRKKPAAPRRLVQIVKKPKPPLRGNVINLSIRRERRPRRSDRRRRQFGTTFWYGAYAPHQPERRGRRSLRLSLRHCHLWGMWTGAARSEGAVCDASRRTPLPFGLYLRRPPQGTHCMRALWILSCLGTHGMRALRIGYPNKKPHTYVCG